MPKKKTVKQEESEVKDFTEIGGSPVPGLTLRHVLRGHTDKITRVHWSLDGKALASCSVDKTIRVWDIKTGALKLALTGAKKGTSSVIIAPTKNILAYSSFDGTIRFCDLISGVEKKIILGHQGEINDLTSTKDGQVLISASDDHDIKMWNMNQGDLVNTLKGHTDNVMSVQVNNSTGNIVSASDDGTLKIWNTSNGENISTVHGIRGFVNSLAISPDGQTFAIASSENIIQIYNPFKSDLLNEIEGHTDGVTSVSFSSNGNLLASKGLDNTVRLWDLNTGTSIAIINESSSNDNSLAGISFHPTEPMLATLGYVDQIIRIWDLDYDKLIALKPHTTSVRYTTAKLMLVGDSGVGKTGLGWRLAHNEFKDHVSTHGQQFWTIPQLGIKSEDGTECEAVLWDLAGQHVYRQVHSLFLENITAALVIFDPTNRQDPLKGVQFWLEQLKVNGELPPTVLVGARVDRGSPVLSQAELDLFCQRHGVTGGYISTSAMKGDGLEKLIEILKNQIPWDKMITTVTTITFKRIKDYVLSLKENTDRKWVLVSPARLRELLEDWAQSELGESWEFTDAEMMTAVGHLETYRIASIIKNSSGENHILLSPELLINTAATIMLLADKNPRELGSISETEILQGKISIDELKTLEITEQQILIDAAILRFLEHNICFRETLNEDTLLIFPSLIKQKRPLQDDLFATDDISYIVRGRIENLYASLVVLLGYTPFFTRINQWQNQAQYEMNKGDICGFRSIEEREGEVEFILYYGDKMPQDGREKFQELFEQFLYQRDVEVTRFPPVICKNGHQQKRATVVERAKDGKKFVFCDECGEKVVLPDFEKPQIIGIGASPWLQREEAMARLRSLYEKQLTNIKSYRRGWASPRVFISRLPEQNQWAEKLIHDLWDAGVYIVEKPEDLKVEDFAIILDTQSYQKAFQAYSPILANDAKVVRSRLSGSNEKLLSLACEGTMLEHNQKQCIPGDFCDETHYSVSLFNLLLELYAIPLNHKGFEPLRKSLHEQWEQSLAGKGVKEMPSALKVFISYSHKDEEFKDELVTMLAGLQRRGVVDAWQDRRIEAGDEWLKEIEGALDTCDMAVLLVSADFLASRFITEKELPVFIKRREKEGMIVVPIFVRDCLWRSEPFIADLQGLPADGKAVITFPKANGDRDRTWMKIAEEIERRAKEKSG